MDTSYSLGNKKAGDEITAVGAVAPGGALAAVLVHSDAGALPADTPTVRGFDWERWGETDADGGYEALLAACARTGFQATQMARAAAEIQRMLQARAAPHDPDTELGADPDPYQDDPYLKKRSGCTIFLGYTSNMISSGLRDTVRFLVRHRLVDCIVTTAGGVEEDLIKCLAPTYIGEFELAGAALRARGINRIGNLLVPNDNYCRFEQWVMPLLDEMLDEQPVWTPAKVAARLGERINHEDSVLYWAWRNKIPVFSPALTDGSLGDMMYFHSYRRPGLVLDILEDLRRLNTLAVRANSAGIIVLGGGLVKHHICNACLMRNGAEYAVLVNTASEYDGSDAGARPDEAVSWGKIRASATPVKLHADATLVFPLLVAQTFANYHYTNKKNV